MPKFWHGELDKGHDIDGFYGVSKHDFLLSSSNGDWTSCREEFSESYNLTHGNYYDHMGRLSSYARSKHINARTGRLIYIKLPEAMYKKGGRALQVIPRFLMRLERILGIGHPSKVYKCIRREDDSWNSYGFENDNSGKAIRGDSVVIDPSRFWHFHPLKISFLTAALKALCSVGDVGGGKPRRRLHELPNVDSKKRMLEFLLHSYYFRSTEYPTKRFLNGYTRIRKGFLLDQWTDGLSVGGEMNDNYYMEGLLGMNSSRLPETYEGRIDHILLKSRS